MKPVYQTLFCVGRGNCLSTCIASLLELSIEQVPNFCAAADVWPRNLDEWPEERALFSVDILIPENTAVIYPIPSAYCLLSGRSPRGEFLHCVVGQTCGADGFSIVHAPHPSGGGLAGRVEIVTFLAALEPHQVAATALLGSEVIA